MSGAKALPLRAARFEPRVMTIPELNVVNAAKALARAESAYLRSANGRQWEKITMATTRLRVAASALLAAEAKAKKAKQ